MDSAMEPGYLKLYRSGGLDERIERLQGILRSCELCPRKCRKNRLEGEIGYCQAGSDLMVSSAHPHFGEEDPLVGPERFQGRGGSGTIFFTGCNLGCIYCQNYDISHLWHGSRVSQEELASNMIWLQRVDCYNVNFVTPTHFVPQIVSSLKMAADMGLKVPVVYNCGGYENVETIKLLEGIVDIYMPDIKYSDSRVAERCSNTPDYFDRCREAVREMHRQVGDLKLGKSGIAERGLLVRHLVLPNGLAGSRDVMKFLSEEISRDTYVNIMFQYHPLFRASGYHELNRRPNLEEYQEVIEIATEMGLYRGFGRD